MNSGGAAELPNPDLLADLNPQQLGAVTHAGGPCLVLAGAGSGKTRVLTYRIVHLISERKVPPHRICAVTFTNKAAAEMRVRVRILLGGQPEGLWLSTFHALGLRLLREWAGREGAPPEGFAVYDRDSALAVWRRCQAALQVSARDYDPARLHGLCSRAVNRLEDPASWSEVGPRWDQRIAGRVWSEYRRALSGAGAVDFDDLLFRPLQLISKHDDLRHGCHRRFRHLLVDEYQDTNRLQYRLVRSLLGEGDELMVVGDEDQSIYRWRGADLHNVLDFQNDFPGASVIRLEQNYRSTQPILSAAGSLVSHNRQRLGKTLWTEAQGGELPVFVQCATDRQEAEWVAAKIESLIESGVEVPGIAVLFRTNAQSRLFEEVFLARRLAHRVIGGPRFFARREVRDLIAYLQLLVHPDDIALQRAVSVPSRGIGPATLTALASVDPDRGAAATLQDLASQADPKTALRAAGCPAAAVPRLLSFNRMLDDLRRLAEEASLPDLVRATLDRSGYAATLAHQPEAEERIANLGELIAAAEETIFSPAGDTADPGRSGEIGLAHGAAEAGSTGEHAARAPQTSALHPLAAFLDRIALLTDTESERGTADGVRLMTVHAAKGLEFDAVFLVGMEEELFPHATAIASGQLEEERRLCYVGITRARKQLFLSAARSRRYHGSERWQEPSRFIGEIDPRHLLVHDQFPRSPRSPIADRAASRRRRLPTSDDASGPASPWPTRLASDADLRAGARVLHPIFGPGKITTRQGSGQRLKLNIRFQKAGTKTILARYANLELID